METDAAVMSHLALLLLVKDSKACSKRGNNAPEGYRKSASDALDATACCGDRSIMYTAEVIYKQGSSQSSLDLLAGGLGFRAPDARSPARYLTTYGVSVLELEYGNSQ